MQSRTFWKTLTIHLTVVVGLAISGGAPSGIMDNSRMGSLGFWRMTGTG